MPKTWTKPNCRPQPSLSRLACLLLALSCSSNPAAAQTVPSVPPAVHVYSGTRTVLSTGTTVTGQPIRYPSG